MMMPPIGPHYDPEQARTVYTHDIVPRQQPATLGTWIVGIVLVIAALAWMTLLVTRSQHTSAPVTTAVPAALPPVTRAR